MPFEPIGTAKDIQPVNDLALRLYRQLLRTSAGSLTGPQHGNFVFSPTSLLISLREAFLASQGKSREQIQKVLNNIPDESLRVVFHDLGALLQAGNAKEKDRHYDFFAGTKVLVHQQTAVQPKYTEELKTIGAGNGDVLGTVQADVKAIESLINQLAQEATAGRIQSFATEEALKMEKDAVLLLSLSHFAADWEAMFLKRSSVKYEGRGREEVQALPATLEDFHNADGSTAKVLMVHLQGKVFLTRDENLKVTIAELPMSQYHYSLLIVLPDDAGKNSLKYFEEHFKEDTFEILRQHWQMPLTHVYLPKFSLENHFSLSKPLQELGVKDLFSSSKADLSNLSSASTGLHVTDVLHAASIDISCETGEPLPPYKPRAGECSGGIMPDTFATGFHVNRPFFFLVRPRNPEMWCMMGRVVHLDDEPDVTVWNHHKRQKIDA